jgi:mannose-1-phosphate guanylyltransferase
VIDTALALVGGEGTRLRPLTLTQPKPAVQLVDRPFVRYMVDWLARHGVAHVVMACGFGAQAVREALDGGSGDGPRISYVEEPEPLGTAGPVRLAADEGLLGDRFLVLNGDVLTDLDLTGLMRTHDERDAVATIALYPVEDPSHYGLVRREEDGEVLAFVEKPEPGQVDTDEVNAGAYVLESPVVDLIPRGTAVSIEREVFPRLVGQGLYGRRLEGYWMDIGTPERYLDACWDILARKAETEPGAKLDDDGRYVSDEAKVGDATVAELAWIDADCEIASGATIGPRAVLGAGVDVGEGATIATSALHPSCRVGATASVTGSILAAGAVVEDGAVVPEGSVIGAGAIITADANLETGARVQPEDTV